MANELTTKQAKPGRVYLDIDAKIAAAKIPEEKAAWESKRDDLEKHNTDFCEGWHVGIYKQACGHWEILQSPLYKNYDGTSAIVDGKPYTTEDADRTLRENSTKRQCTRCICKW